MEWETNREFHQFLVKMLKNWLYCMYSLINQKDIVGDSTLNALNMFINRCLPRLMSIFATNFMSNM